MSVGTQFSGPAHSHFQVNCVPNVERIENFQKSKYYFENNWCRNKKFISNNWKPVELFFKKRSFRGRWRIAIIKSTRQDKHQN